MDEKQYLKYMFLGIFWLLKIINFFVPKQKSKRLMNNEKLHNLKSLSKTT